MEIEGRAALVTGGARRIGRAICLGLAEQGARVAIHYRNSQQDAQDVSNRCPNSVTLQADLDNATEARELVRRAHGELGGIDILINNAAIYERVAIEDIDEAAWDRHLDADLKGPFFAAQEAGKLMQAAGNGLIVNLTDWGVQRPHPEFLPYYAAKAGLAAMTAGLARAFAPSVRVNAIAAGPILMPQDSDPAYAEKIRKLTLLNRMGGVQSVVLTVLFLISNEYVTGETITVDGGRSLR